MTGLGNSMRSRITALLGSHRVSPDNGMCIRSIGVLGGVLGAGGVDRVI